MIQTLDGIENSSKAKLITKHLYGLNICNFDNIKVYEIKLDDDHLITVTFKCLYTDFKELGYTKNSKDYKKYIADEMAEKL